MPKTNYDQLSLEELDGKESELRTELFNLRVQNTTKALENTRRIGETRREIARVLTAVRRKQAKS